MQKPIIHIQELLKQIEHQEFLTNFEKYRKDFIEKYNIKLSEYESYVLCKYHTIIEEWNDLTKQTRGIVLDSQNNWQVVNFPFTKFFNIHEQSAATINWQSVDFQEKRDGSIIYFWWATRLNKWMLSTSGTCNAYEAKLAYGKSFGELVEEVLNTNFGKAYNFYKLLDKDLCYIFELESEYNQIVVDQADNTGKLTLLGARNLMTFFEIDLDCMDLSCFKPIEFVKKYNLTKHTVKEFVNSRSPKEAEGLVICDCNFNRIKIKSEEYLRVHRLKGGVGSSWKNVLELVLSDILDDARGLLGKLENDRLDTMQNKVDKHLKKYIEVLNGVPEICLQERAEMGKYIKENNLGLYSSFIWQCHFGGKATIEVFKELASNNSNKVAKMLMESY